MPLLHALLASCHVTACLVVLCSLRGAGCLDWSRHHHRRHSHHARTAHARVPPPGQAPRPGLGRNHCRSPVKEPAADVGEVRPATAPLARYHSGLYKHSWRKGSKTSMGIACQVAPEVEGGEQTDAVLRMQPRSRKGSKTKMAMHHAETVGLVDQTPEMVEMASPGAMGDGGEKDVSMGGSSLAGRMYSI